MSEYLTLLLRHFRLTLGFFWYILYNDIMMFMISNLDLSNKATYRAWASNRYQVMFGTSHVSMDPCIGLGKYMFYEMGKMLRVKGKRCLKWFASKKIKKNFHERMGLLIGIEVESKYFSS